MITKEKLLIILRENPKTISELAAELGLARTAITSQLDRLIHDGMVQKGITRRHQSAGKPAQEYRVTPGTEDAGSTAYLPFVASLLETLPAHLNRDERNNLLEQVGKHMALKAGLGNNGTLEERIEKAISIVNQLGASAQLIRNEKDIIIQNITCPLASAVRSEPCVCNAVAAFFTEATGANTRAECQHGDHLICKYVIEK